MIYVLTIYMTIPSHKLLLRQPSLIDIPDAQELTTAQPKSCNVSNSANAGLLKEFHTASAGISMQTKSPKIHIDSQQPKQRPEDDGAAFTNQPVKTIVDLEYLYRLPKLKKFPKSLTSAFKDQLTHAKLCFGRGEFSDAIKLTKELISTLSAHKQEIPALKNVLEKILIAARIANGEIEASLTIPVKTRQEFIAVHLELARFAESDLSKIENSKELTLYAYRRASDAGSDEAKVQLIKRLLFCLNDMPYLPFEAEKLLLQIAQCDTRPKYDESCAFETAIAQLETLLRTALSSKDTMSNKAKRDALVFSFKQSDEPLIRALEPFLYLSPVFGEINILKGEKPLSRSDVKVKTPQNIAHVWKYWQMQYYSYVGHASAKKQSEQLLLELTNDSFLAAFHTYTDKCLRGDDTRLCFTAFDKGTKLPSTKKYLSPDLCLSLYQCYNFIKHQVIDLDDKKKLSSSTHVITHRENQKKQANTFIQKARQHGHDCALFIEISPHLKEHTSQNEYQKIGQAEPIELADPVKDLLREHPFSYSPTICIISHLQQTLRNQKPDENLIQIALKKDRLQTSLTSLYFNYFTETLVRSDLISYLHEHSDLSVADFNRFLCLNIYLLMDALEYYRFVLTCSDPVRVLQLLSKVRTENKKFLNQSSAIVVDEIHENSIDTYLGYLVISGQIEKAKKVAKKSTDWLNKKHKVKSESKVMYRDPQKKIDNLGEQQFRQNIPLHFKILREIETNCYLPIQTNLSYQNLLSTFDSLNENTNPEVWYFFCNVCKNFLLYSSCHLTYEQFVNLLDKYHHALTHSLRNNNNLMLYVVNNIRQTQSQLTTKQSNDAETSSELMEVLEKINSELKSSHCPPKPATLAAGCRLPNRSDFYMFGIEHQLVSMARLEESTEKRFDLLHKITATRFFCPLTIHNLFPSAIDELPNDLKEIALHILIATTQQLLGLQTEIEESLNDFPLIRIQLFGKFKQFHTEEAKEICFQTTLENDLLQLVTKRSHLLSKIDTYDLNGKDEEELYVGLRECFKEAPEQYMQLMNSLAIPSKIMDWYEYIESSLTKYAINEIKSRISEFKTENEASKFIANYYLKRDKNTADYLLKVNIIHGVKNDQYFIMVWFAFEADLITRDVASRCIQRLPKGEPNTLFLKACIEKDLSAAEGLIKKAGLDKDNFTDYKQKQLLPTLGITLFELNQPMQAMTCFKLSEQHARLALLQWKHKLGDEISSIPTTLLTAAASGNSVGQCRLLDWHLEHKDLEHKDLEHKDLEHKDIDIISIKRCCRYLLTPPHIYSPEKELYQGVIYFLGIEVPKSEEKAFFHFNNALQVNNPLPCFSLIALIKKQHIVKNAANFMADDSTGKDVAHVNLYQLFSEKILIYSRDIFPELLFSFSKNEILTFISDLYSQGSIENANPSILEAHALMTRKVTEWNDSAVKPESPSVLQHKLLPQPQQEQSSVSDQNNPVISLSHCQHDQLTEFSQDALISEFKSIEKSKKNTKAVRNLFKSIKEQSEKDELLRLSFDILCPKKMTGDDLKSDSFKERRDLLVSLLSENFNLLDSFVEPIALLLTSYRLQKSALPINLEQLLITSDIAFLEKTLLSQGEHTYHLKSLFVALCKRSKRINFSILPRMIFDPLLDDGSKLIALNLLVKQFPIIACTILSDGQYITGSKMHRLFRLLTLDDKKALLSERYHGKQLITLLNRELFKQVERKYSDSTRPHTEDIARKLLSNQKATSIHSLLQSYFELEKLDSSSLKAAVSKKIVTLCEKLSDIKLEDWNGDDLWLLAKAVIQELQSDI